MLPGISAELPQVAEARTRITIAHTESSLGWGGQEIRVLAEMQGMRERGHRLLLAAPPASRIFAACSEAGFATLPLATGKLALPGNALRLADWFGAQQVDIVNPHSSRDGWAAGIGGRLAGVPTIIRSRHFHVPIYSRFTSRVVYARLADHLLTTSPAVRGQFIRAFDFPGARVSTIPTGINPDRFCPIGERAKLPFPNDGVPVVGMIAVIRRAKGHPLLVRAAARLRERGLPIRLLFVGDGPSRPPIEEEVDRCGLTDAVHFTGHRDDVPEILRALDCVALPSLHESIPQTALQAMASGVPVIGSDVGGIPSVVRHGQTGRIFARDNVEALANCLERVFNEPGETDELCRQARAFVKSEHSVERMLERLERLYARLLLTRR